MVVSWPDAITSRAEGQTGYSEFFKANQKEDGARSFGLTPTQELLTHTGLPRGNREI